MPSTRVFATEPNSEEIDNLSFSNTEEKDLKDNDKSYRQPPCPNTDFSSLGGAFEIVMGIVIYNAIPYTSHLVPIEGFVSIPPHSANLPISQSNEKVSNLKRNFLSEKINICSEEANSSHLYTLLSIELYFEKTKGDMHGWAIALEGHHGPEFIYMKNENVLALD